MVVAKIKITGADAVVSELKTITSGMIGATVSIEYDDTWAELNKQVVFRGPCGAVNAEGKVIPDKCLPAHLQFPTVTAADAGKTLRFVVDAEGNWVPEIVDET